MSYNVRTSNAEVKESSHAFLPLSKSSSAKICLYRQSRPAQCRWLPRFCSCRSWHGWLSIQSSTTIITVINIIWLMIMPMHERRWSITFSLHIDFHTYCLKSILPSPAVQLSIANECVLEKEREKECFGMDAEVGRRQLASAGARS